MIQLNMSIEQIKNLIRAEEKRQHDTVSLIASENCSSADVREANGSRLTDKYAEGYPNRRYYNGCSLIDEIELLAIDAACKLFGCKFANVQPHSGSQANQAIFNAFLAPGDQILSLDLHHGGHLTHGSKANSSGKLYRIRHYTTNHDGIIDLNHVADIAKECMPKLIIAGASAYSRVIDWAGFRQIADQVGAYLLADIAHFSGLIAGDCYPSPVGIAHFCTSSTHKVLRGPRGGMIMCDDQSLSKKIDSSVFPGVQGGPLMHVIAAKAICFMEAMEEDFKSYARQVVINAKQLARHLRECGWTIVSGGTDCHMFTLDLRNKRPDLSGTEAADKLSEYGIIVNEEMVPDDHRPVTETSGIRIGSASATSRGMGVEEMALLTNAIDKILLNQDYDKKIIQSMCSKFPLR